MPREYPVYAVTAVGAVLISDKRILLVKRGSEPGKGLWSIPGGAIEAGENIYEAARRELYEETGISAEPVGVIGIINLVIRDRTSKPIYHYVILDILFDENTMQGTLRPGGDAVDVAFIPINMAIDSKDVSKPTRVLLSMLAKEKEIVIARLSTMNVYEISVTT